MSPAGAAIADEDDRLGPSEVTACGEFMDLLGRDLGAAGEAKWNADYLSLRAEPEHGPTLTE